MNRTIPLPLTLAALAVFLLAGVMSSGFHHFDEHYQILEFARYYTSGTFPEDLPWEYHARIRPALQPLLAAFTLKLTDGWSSWYQAMFIRVLMSLFVFAVVLRYLRTWLSHSEADRLKSYAVWAFLSFMIPYLSARFSAEVMGSAFVLLAFSSSESKGRHAGWLTGLWLALAVVVRLQLVFLVAGYGLWVLLVNRPELKRILHLMAGFAAGTAIGLLADRIFYGEWCFTALNYFTVNVVQNKSAEFGTHAWSYYFTLPLKSGLLSLLIAAMFAASLWFFIRNPRHVFTWAIIPFVLGHVVVPHKELRFLFPVCFFMPYMLVWSAYELLNRRALWLLAALMAINVPVMLWKALTPANGQPLLYRRLELLGTEGTVHGSRRGIDLLQSQAGLNMPFYQHHLKVVLLDSSRLDEPPSGSWLCMWPGQGVPERYRQEGQVLPDFLLMIHEKWRVPVRNAEWRIYRKR